MAQAVEDKPVIPIDEKQNYFSQIRSMLTSDILQFSIPVKIETVSKHGEIAIKADPTKKVQKVLAPFMYSDVKIEDPDSVIFTKVVKPSQNHEEEKDIKTKKKKIKFPVGFPADNFISKKSLLYDDGDSTASFSQLNERNNQSPSISNPKTKAKRKHRHHRRSHQKLKSKHSKSHRHKTDNDSSRRRVHISHRGRRSRRISRSRSSSRSLSAEFFSSSSSPYPTSPSSMSIVSTDYSPRSRSSSTWSSTMSIVSCDSFSASPPRSLHTSPARLTDDSSDDSSIIPDSSKLHEDLAKQGYRRNIELPRISQTSNTLPSSSVNLSSFSNTDSIHSPHFEDHSLHTTLKKHISHSSNDSSKQPQRKKNRLASADSNFSLAKTPHKTHRIKEATEISSEQHITEDTSEKKMDQITKTEQNKKDEDDSDFSDLFDLDIDSDLYEDGGFGRRKKTNDDEGDILKKKSGQKKKKRKRKNKHGSSDSDYDGAY
ncbi:uncharacterized protein MONOS_201 [Monocercomonoides exilis]|uniref:uncharacterized protein n=1 Tax=Monocercomonoides exilis TaxID=2049356 RepID=UPI0035593B01|nr:hypothetical protein MONOS_201 [Monocercomonoides exilis]|eukprot:MONOS_201.1-p1 / transcript=MONOS_201.1 / gene=MONOS_201 / organism=Monocercomonoides_exilis_PA203 / gene_product=unspecified product / transcript_product=unspecified product / location=Mono_scaffold00003:242489-244007(+) / protein_length=485 / sequence_SO=supercontig / SO=protein_coding / is_pseudo=false